MTNDRVVTTFSLQEENITFFPPIDPHRICTDEHDLTSCTYSRRGTCATATFYHAEQRRWYEINTFKSSPLDLHEEDFCLEESLMHHIVSHSQPFNTVNIDQYGNTTYEIKAGIGRGVENVPIVSRSIFPIVDYHEIIEKRYLSRTYRHLCVERNDLLLQTN